MANATAEALLSAFDRSPLDRRYWTIFEALLAIGSVLDFFDFFIVGYLVAQLGPQWHLTYGQSSLILLAGGLGAIVSALTWGVLSDKFGRKRQLVAGYLICAFGAGSLALVPDGNWQLFAVLRLAVGFGLAAASVPSLTLIVELTPTRARTVVASFAVVFATVGTLAASVMGATLYSWLGWRTVAALGVAPAVIAIFVQLFVPESVRWLIGKGRFKEARELVARHLGVPVERIPLPIGPLTSAPRAKPGSGVCPSSACLAGIPDHGRGGDRRLCGDPLGTDDHFAAAENHRGGGGTLFRGGDFVRHRRQDPVFDFAAIHRAPTRRAVTPWVRTGHRHRADGHLSRRFCRRFSDVRAFVDGNECFHAGRVLQSRTLLDRGLWRAPWRTRVRGSIRHRMEWAKSSVHCRWR